MTTCSLMARLNLPGSELVPLKRLKHVTVDVLISIAAFWSAYLLRFEFDIPPHEARFALHQLPVVVVAQVGGLVVFGAYRFIWRYIGLRDLRPFVLAAATATVPMLVLRLGLPDPLRAWRVPLSVICLRTILMLMGTLGIRVLRRMIYEQYQQPSRAESLDTRNARPILLVGAGRAGKAAADDIRRLRRADLEIKGFVDDHPGKQRAILHGVPVIGTTADLQTLVRELGIDHVLVTMTDASRLDVQRIVEQCESIPVRVRIVPSLPDLLEGSVSVSRIRDLLGRPMVHLVEAAARITTTGIPRGVEVGTGQRDADPAGAPAHRDCPAGASEFGRAGVLPAAADGCRRPALHPDQVPHHASVAARRSAHHRRG